MAKQLEQFKTDFAAIQHTLATGETEVAGAKTSRIHLDGMVKEHAKEVGRRVRELRTQGTAGATIDDFKNDATAKHLLTEAETYLTQMEKQNTHLKALEAGDWKKLGTSYDTLQKDLTAEIAARKKQTSTALGTGNKSLPDMEKLLVESTKLKARVGALSKFSTRNSGFLNMALFRASLDDTIKDELAKSKDLALSDDQAELFESVLSDRNLRFALATAQSLGRKVTEAVAAAQAAQTNKQADALKQAKAAGAAELKQLDELADKHKKAYDTLGEASIMGTKTGPKIKQTVTTIVSLKQHAHAEIAKMPAA